MAQPPAPAPPAPAGIPPIVELHGCTKILKAALPAGPEGSGRPPLTLIGRSWAGDSTAFCVPELNCGFDAGYVVSAKRLPWYFVTHVHTDHAHHLTHLKSRSKPPTICVPRESTGHVEDFLKAAQKMTAHMTPQEYDDFEWTPAYTLKGVAHGDRFVVDAKVGLYCDVFACDHSVPTVGYRLVRVKQKLKPEYAALPGREIGALRKSGVEVMVSYDVPLLAFLGDTTVEGVLGRPVDEASGNGTPDHVREARALVLSSPVVVIECSFLTDDMRGNAARTKHVLWSDLRPHVVANPDTLFVLIHFTHRVSAAEVRAFFAMEALPNVLPWVGPEAADDVEEIWGHS